MSSQQTFVSPVEGVGYQNCTSSISLVDLLDARASAQNRPLWRIIAKHCATLP